LTGIWLDTDTVTAQGPQTLTRHARSGDFYPAKNGDSDLATNGDFFMATDNRFPGGRWLEGDNDAIP
jgi:hypothetical protein